MQASLYPVILSGGSGTRLWPLSRAMYPKQFISFSREQDASFLSQSLKRLPQKAGFAQPILICNNDHRFLVLEDAERTGVFPSAIILEPMARNTAPAIAVAALHIMAKDPSGIMVVMPSDHMIRDEAAFASAVKQAAAVANAGRLVLFGIKPDSPHTGYGYIRRGGALKEFDGAYAVAQFTEKPQKKVAEKYVASGEYAWNSGIFVFSARTFIEELGRLEPAILRAAEAALKGSRIDLGFVRLDAEAFEKAPSISIDYAVMERTERAAVIPIDVGWSDVGSWSSLWELAKHDDHGNAVEGEALLEDTQNCYVYSDRALVTTLGVKDLVIVDTPDAVLVADRNQVQNVSQIVKRLKDEGRREYQTHVRSHRPWGFFETLSLAPRFQVKLLHVKPGGKLSMQMHHHRSEHWVVVHGTAKVTVGDSEKLVRENESVYIVATQWHRLENPGKTPLEMIEVQIGSYLGEDDIVRSDDIYQRAPDETK